MGPRKSEKLTFSNSKLGPTPNKFSREGNRFDIRDREKVWAPWLLKLFARQIQSLLGSKGNHAGISICNRTAQFQKGDNYTSL